MIFTKCAKKKYWTKIFLTLKYKSEILSKNFLFPES